MAKAYRREKIVKFAKRILLNNKLLLEGLTGTENDTQYNKAFINFQNSIAESFVKELCIEFDIKEEEIT